MSDGIALVQLPWAALQRPSIQLALVQALLKRAGMAADVLPLDLHLARCIGPAIYQLVNGRMPRFMGEWFFARALFGERVPDYLGRVQDRLGESPSFVAEEWSALRRLGREGIPSLIDDAPSLVARRLGREPRVVGFSCTHDQLLPALAIGRAVKDRFPQCQVVLGGAQVEGEAGPAIVEAFPWIDWVVDGEAEHVAAPLFRALLEGAAAPPVPFVPIGDGRGVVRSDPTDLITDLDRLPIVDYGDYLRGNPEQVSERIQLQVELSRGCAWARGRGPCGFCGLNPLPVAQRRKSPARIAEELESLASSTWLLDLAVTDTLLNPSLAKALVEVQADGTELNVFAEVRPVEYASRPELLAEAGVWHVQAGVESLDDRLLELLRKGANRLDNIAFLKGAAANGVRVIYNLLYGIPGEDEQDYGRMLRLLPLLHHLMPPNQLLRINIVRHSPYFEERRKLGIRNVQPAGEYDYLFPADSLDASRVAYLFDADVPTTAGEDVLNELHIALQRWCRSLMAGAGLTVRRGPGFTQLVDSRLPERPRSMVLTGAKEQVLMACDVPRSLQWLQERLELDESELLREVEELVVQELALFEHGRVLGLPLPWAAPPVGVAELTRRVEGGYVLAPTQS